MLNYHIQNLPGKFRDFFLKLGQPFEYNYISDSKALQMAMISGAWYSISQTIARGISSLPYVLKEETSDGFREVTEGEYFDVIFRPNEDQTLSELLELQSYYFLANGELYQYLDRPSIGFIEGTQSYSLPPELITPQMDKQNSILSNVVSYQFNDGAIKTILPQDMLHVIMPNPVVNARKTKNGLSPLQAGQNLLNGSTNIETAISWYFENRGISALISGAGNTADMVLGKNDRDSIEKGWLSRIGGAFRMNKPMITSKPVTVNQLNASSTDMQMIDNQRMILERLCALVNLPPVLVQSNENSTYNNVREAKMQAYHECIIPYAERILKGYDRTYLKEISREAGRRHTLGVNYEEIQALQPTPFEKRKEDREDVRAGIITRNEARERQGVEILEDEAMNQATVQNNIVPINTIEK